MDNSDYDLPWSTLLPVSGLNSKHPNPFNLEPDLQTRMAIADDLELLELQKLTFEGDIRASGQSGWLLSAQLGATVVQTCVVSLDPVKTRIEDEIKRQYFPETDQPEPAGETEIPEDVTFEILADTIDIGNVMVEALALRLPLFPRAADIEPVNITVSAPGVTPMSDQDMRPFAELKSLRDKLLNPQK